MAFGLVHIPGELYEPLRHADWAMLKTAILDYGPKFPMQILTGLLLGVLWLRTGSIALIAVTHALFNMGTSLALGL